MSDVLMCRRAIVAVSMGMIGIVSVVGRVAVVYGGGADRSGGQTLMELSRIM